MRFVKMRLVNPAEKMPMPAPYNRLFVGEGEFVDLDDPFWHARQADGSIEEVPAEAPVEAPAAPPAPASNPVVDVAAAVAELH